MNKVLWEEKSLCWKIDICSVEWMIFLLLGYIFIDVTFVLEYLRQDIVNILEKSVRIFFTFYTLQTDSIHLTVYVASGSFCRSNKFGWFSGEL